MESNKQQAQLQFLQKTTTKRSPPSIDPKTKVPTASDSKPTTPSPSYPSSRRASIKDESPNGPGETSPAYTSIAAGKEIASNILSSAKAVIIAYPRLSTFILSQLIVSSVPVALFFVGLAITTTFAAGAFTFFAFLFLAPISVLTLFLGLCLWSGLWATWLLYEAVGARYLSGGDVSILDHGNGKVIDHGI